MGVNGIPRCYYDLYVRSGYWQEGRKTNPPSDKTLWLYDGLVKLDSNNKVISSTRTETDKWAVINN